jgi:hypothetical protein
MKNIIAILAQEYTLQFLCGGGEPYVYELYNHVIELNEYNLLTTRHNPTTKPISRSTHPHRIPLVDKKPQYDYG